VVPLRPGIAQWAELTRRLVALHRRDPARWQECTARSDALEAQGVDALTAVRQALEEHGG